MPNEDVDLKRFENAHEGMFDLALSEIRSGEKRAHWMWFVFPQVEGLGNSYTARRFAIHDWDEAVAFMDHPVLGPNYMTAVDAVAEKVQQDGMRIGRLFPWPDDLKLVSSLTLFTAVVASWPIGSYSVDRWQLRAEAILAAARAEGYETCAVTERFLERRRSDGSRTA